MPTKAQLVTAIMDRLGTGDNPMVEDVQKVTSVIGDKLDDLALRGVISYIADDNELPGGSLDWLSRVMEQVIVKAFGGAEDGDAILYAERMLRSQIQQNVPEIRKQQYF